MIVYKKSDGEIIGKIPDDQKIETYYIHLINELPIEEREKFVQDLDIIENVYIQDSYKFYKIINQQLIRKTDEEINEIRTYGGVLSDEERMLTRLKPSQSEIEKAENTIEILYLLQEVL